MLRSTKLCSGDEIRDRTESAPQICVCAQRTDSVHRTESGFSRFHTRKTRDFQIARNPDLVIYLLKRPVGPDSWARGSPGPLSGGPGVPKPGFRRPPLFPNVFSHEVRDVHNLSSAVTAQHTQVATPTQPSRNQCCSPRNHVANPRQPDHPKVFAERRRDPQRSHPDTFMVWTRVTTRRSRCILNAHNPTTSPTSCRHRTTHPSSATRGSTPPSLQSPAKTRMGTRPTRLTAGWTPRIKALRDRRGVPDTLPAPLNLA